MRKLAGKQMCALFPVKTPKFSARVVVSSLIFAGLMSSGFLSLPVKIPLLALSAVFFFTYFLKKKKALDESATRHKNLTFHPVGMVDKHFQQETQQVAESDGERSASETVMFQKGSADLPAGSESTDELVERKTFELDSVSSENGSCSPLVCSSEDDDGDYGSFIEISLPSIVCVDNISPMSIVQKQEVTQVLPEDEINEEDSFIELDMSMGSIKSSKFGI